MDVAQAAEADPEALLVRMRSGDREAAAEFVARFGPRIRRRVRGKLGPAMRRLFDSQEIMSTLGRRLDTFVGSGRLRAGSMPELWALLFRLADNSLVDKARVFRGLEAKEGADSPFAHRMAARLRESERLDPDGPLIEIDRAMSSLQDPVDREILSLWLQGSSHNEIAGSVGLAPTAVRKRWQGIRERLRELYESGRF
jgi:DNA-directed RNA polymerase specialized sigma24 family protein